MLWTSKWSSFFGFPNKKLGLLEHKRSEVTETVTVRNVTFQPFLVGEAKELFIVKNSYGTGVSQTNPKLSTDSN